MQGVQETDFAKRWFVGPWLALLGLKLWLASRLPLFVDEAFYWQEGRHLAWAYSDLPGLTAWLARIGDGLGDGTLALRLPFLAIAAAIPGARLVLFDGMGHDLPEPLFDAIVGELDTTFAQFADAR